MDSFLDTLAIVLWVLAALFPIFTLVFFWRRYKQMKWYYKILLALLIGGIGGYISFWIGLSLILRHGVKMF